MDFPTNPIIVYKANCFATLFYGVQRLATSAYKPARLGKSLLLGLSRRSGQTYPLVADRVASQPCFYFTFSITSFAATSPVLTGATSA